MNSKSITKDHIKKFFSNIVRIRRIEQAIAERYHLGEMKCPMHLSVGQEGPAVGISMFLNPADKMLSTHRSHAHYLAKGGDLNRMIAELFGRASGCSAGMGGSMHLIDRSCGFEGATAIVGNTIPIATGVSLSQKISNSDSFTVVCFGEGATEEGVFYECLNLASVKNLPLVFLVENNRYSVYTPLAPRQSHKRSITKVAEAHGIKTLTGNGNQAQEVMSICKHATDYVRNERKPVLLEINTYRYLEHCGPNNDDHLNYRSSDEIKHWLSNDVIKQTEWDLFKIGIDANQLHSSIKKDVDLEVENAFAFANDACYPSIEKSASYEYA